MNKNGIFFKTRLLSQADGENVKYDWNIRLYKKTQNEKNCLTKTIYPHGLMEWTIIDEMRIIILTKTNHKWNIKVVAGFGHAPNIESQVLRMVNSYPSFPAVFPAMPSRGRRDEKRYYLSIFKYTLFPLKASVYYLSKTQTKYE